MASSGGATIGALRVVIGADTAALDKGLKQAQSSVSSFAKQVGTIAAGIQLERILTSAFNNIAYAIKKSIVQADDFGKMAQKVGMPVEEFSKLAYAADLSDVSVESLSKSLGQLNKNMVATAGGAGGAAAQAFTAMGISVTNANGSLKTQRQVLDEIATKFASYEDGAAKSALAIAIFGKAGADIIPLMNEGAAGIKKAADEATRFGIVITQDMANSSQNLRDNFTRISAIVNGLMMQISGPLATALDHLSTQFVAAAGDGRLMQEAGKLIVEVLAFMTKEIAIVVVNIRALKDEWTGLRGVMTANLLETGALTAAWERWKATSDQTAASVRNIQAEYQKTIDTFRQNINSPWAGETTKLQNMSSELGRMFTTWSKLPAPIIATGNAASGASKGLREAETAARAAEAAIAKLMEEGKRVEEEVLPTQKYAAEVKKLNELWAAGAVSAEAYALKLSMIKYPGLTQAVIDAGDFNKQIDSFSVSSVNTMASALTDIVTGAKSAKEAFTEMARSILRDLINMIIKAMLFQYIVAPIMGLPTGGVGGFVMGAGLPKFAKGGSFKVGGSGPVDSQLVAFRATPGERVDVRTPGQQRDMNPAVNVDGRVRIVNAFDAVDFFSKALGESGGEKVILNWVRANPSAFRAALA